MANILKAGDLRMKKKKTRAALADRIISCVTSMIIDYQIDNAETLKWTISLTIDNEKFEEFND